MRTAGAKALSPVLFCCATFVLAGAQAAPPTVGRALAEQQKPPEEMVTIVGCLVRGNAAGARTDAVAQTEHGTTGDFFVRTPALAVPVGSTVTIGKPDATGRSTGTSAGPPTGTTLYRIAGLDHAQLAPHVGHRVELVGHLLQNSPETAAKASTEVDSTGRATTRVDTRIDVAGLLHASSVKMVNASCP